jgi:hypothetical protein
VSHWRKNILNDSIDGDTTLRGGGSKATPRIRIGRCDHVAACQIANHDRFLALLGSPVVADEGAQNGVEPVLVCLAWWSDLGRFAFNLSRPDINPLDRNGACIPRDGLENIEPIALSKLPSVGGIVFGSLETPVKFDV